MSEELHIGELGWDTHLEKRGIPEGREEDGTGVKLVEILTRRGEEVLSEEGAHRSEHGQTASRGRGEQ